MSIILDRFMIGRQRGTLKRGAATAEHCA